MAAKSRDTEVRLQRPRNRKQQILTAARDLFVELGFPSVTMAMIADRVGVTAGALYRHFGNKADLLEAVIEENFGWLGDPHVPDRFDDAMESSIAQIAEFPYLSDLWLHEVRHLSDDSLKLLRRRMLAWHISLMPALRDRRPDLDDDQLDLLGWALKSVLSCLTRRSLHTPEAIRLPSVRSALQAVATVQLVPVGPRGDPAGSRAFPVSMRERLLVAACEQFGYRGFYETSMADIAAMAGVTGPNLYGYFDSKADLLRAVHERGTHALWLGLEGVLSSGRPAPELLPEVVRSYVGLARTWSSTLGDPTGAAGVGDYLKMAQREYIDEWVALLTASAPELEPRTARLRVQIALLLVADLYRVPRISYRQSFQENLVSLVMTVLHDGGRAPSS
ncbi:TetR/AcrR family transcriptional regulator [Qaidamihabitans albus]|uniref:TetR/AcrR family transcriptional regulator n=1 Tax=Qaidamihabitans albus TaxID=2795733 RepID=UPI0018F20688|nr:TetR/AcrR family transcriptional regulator [Qaidamihabitans albus]